MKKPRAQAGYIEPTETFPLDVKMHTLRDEDKRLIHDTFLRLAQLYHKMLWKDAEDCLLLLTTCRNNWYTLNAMYAEAVKWCQEGGNHRGFGDAIDAFRSFISGQTDIRTAAEKAAVILETTAEYLNEFLHKEDIYFVRFDEIHGKLRTFADSIDDEVARDGFLTAFVELGNGYNVEDKLTPPVNIAEEYGNDHLYYRLRVWFGVARPLTSLVRTFISENLHITRQHDKKCTDYINELRVSASAIAAFGFKCPAIPDESLFSWSLTPGTQVNDVLLEKITTLLRFCDEMCHCIRRFLREMLPGKDSLHERFILNRPEEESVLRIGDTLFKREPNVFVLIMDMRNSTGEPYRTPELKVFIEQVISQLRSDNIAASDPIYDDQRIVTCNSLVNLILSAARIRNSMEVRRDPVGFAGLRMAAVCGEMLFDYQGDWGRVKEAAPADSSHNTIARAARLMSIDKDRWGFSDQSKKIASALGDWATDESLLFFDASIFEIMPQELRSLCRGIDIVDFRGIGPKQCWASKIQEIAGVQCIHV